ncbi:MAG: hypothetical protein GY754_00485 [bacterium]|nr:hypothetical protein [bacterium]
MGLPEKKGYIDRIFSNKAEKSPQIADIIDKYQLFHTEAIMHGSSVPPFSRIRAIFSNLSQEEFIDIATSITEKDASDTLNLFLYYIILFRDMENIQRFINCPEFGINLLEKLIVFAYGYCFLYDYTPEHVLDEMLSFVSEERFLELAIASRHIARDQILLLYILSKLDTASLNKYFAAIDSVAQFLKDFVKIPDDMMPVIINRNYELFQYILMLMSENKKYLRFSKDFYSKYKTGINRDYKGSSLPEKEKHISFKERNMSRISYLVNQVRGIANPQKAIAYFHGERLFADEEEMQIISAVVTNPVFNSTFKRYNSVFSIEKLIPR